jgi:hypothetical protein
MITTMRAATAAPVAAPMTFRRVEPGWVAAAGRAVAVAAPPVPNSCGATVGFCTTRYVTSGAVGTAGTLSALRSAASAAGTQADRAAPPPLSTMTRTARPAARRT